MSGWSMPTTEHETYMNDVTPLFPNSSRSITDHYRDYSYLFRDGGDDADDDAPEEGQNVVAGAAQSPASTPQYPGPPPPDALEENSSTNSSPAESEALLTPPTTSIPTPRLAKRKAELVEGGDYDWKGQASGSSNSLGLNLPPRSGKLKENLPNLPIPAATSSRGTRSATRQFPSAPANTLTGDIQRIPSDGKGLTCPFGCTGTYSSQTLRRHLRAAQEHSGRWFRAIWEKKALTERDLATLISVMIGLKFKAEHCATELTEDEMEAAYRFQFDLEAYSETELVLAKDHPTMSVFYRPLRDLARGMACVHCGKFQSRNLKKHVEKCKVSL